MTRKEQISNGFTEMMKGFWGNQDLKVPDFEEPCKQEPCEDAISRQAVLDGLASIAKVKAKSDAQKSLMGRVMFFVEQLPPVTPQEPRKNEVILTEEEYGELVSSEFDNGYAKGYTEALEQNDVLDKIRERVELEKLGYPPSAGYYRAIMKVLQIIDKYKSESEE
jgi:hypothetical protein